MDRHKIEDTIIEMTSNGYSFRYIARYLNQEKLSNRENGKPWTVKNIMSFLEDRQTVYLIIRMSRTLPMHHVLNKLNEERMLSNQHAISEAPKPPWTPASVFSLLSREGFDHFIRGSLLLQ